MPKSLDYMDVLSKGMERRISKSRFFLRPFVQIEAQRLKKYEHFIFNSFQNKIIISEQDRDLIIHAKNDHIEIIRNGVDEEFFEPRISEVKYDLIFTGNMSYPPNVDGVEYLVNKVLPLVWKENPAVTLAIVGANPTQKVLGFAQKNIIVTGWVDDIRAYYAASKVFIAPMQIGTGLQNKLLEAMSMKLPCITSILANNALNAVDQKSILIAETPEQYKVAIDSLLTNQEYSNKIAAEGKKFVGLNYDWQASTEQLENLFLKHGRT
jgi:glycosyltransferase involved in cell wall biosynthesis